MLFCQVCYIYVAVTLAVIDFFKIYSFVVNKVYTLNVTDQDSRPTFDRDSATQNLAVSSRSPELWPWAPVVSETPVQVDRRPLLCPTQRTP